MSEISKRLEECEAIIERGLATFVDVGNAIREIRDQRLYREQFDTFEEYCRHRWGWSRQHAYRQMEAANTVSVLEGLSPIGDKPESQIRELSPLAKEDPEAAQHLMEELIRDHGEKLTAKKVKTAVKAAMKREKEFSKLGDHVSEVVKEIDPSDSDLPTSTRQLNYLGGVDDEAERLDIATRVADGSAKTVWEASSQLKAERGEANALEDLSVVQVVRAGHMEYIVEWSDGSRSSLPRKDLLERQWKKCSHCSGLGIEEK